MKKEEPKLLITDTYVNIPAPVWEPKSLIRWKRIELINRMRYEKVLQQLWISNMGEQEWRDVPEEE